MTDAELEELLDDLESDRVERTESTTNGEKFRQAVCAFANDLPDHRQVGVLFVGVTDEGTPIGVSITDQLLQNLAAMRGDGNIIPLPSLDVQKRRLKGMDVAVVFVHPSSAPPVRVKGTVWIRSGPRRGVANPDDERRLNEKRRFLDLPTDIRPVISASLSDLDDLLFQRTYLPSSVSVEVLDQNQRSVEHQLLALRFAHPGDTVCPTVLGILAVGKTPTDWIPCAYVQFLRIDGKELGDPIKDSREINGALPDLLNEIEDLLKANNQTSVDFTSERVEVQSPDYPLVALQQIVRNAILHRSYENTNAPVRLYWFSDRVEIQNPGGPFGQVTKENFGKPGAYDYRNPNLAAAMKDLGYVQRFGFGIATARRELEKNGNPELEFQVEDSCIAAIIRRRL
ncbi:MAG: transcriptional regulator [Pirellulaceae bacterium]|nr:transcriptional regulator [Pirellulaceae bacterium]